MTYGRFNELNFEAAVENVVIPDVLTMRSAGKWNQRDGTTRNRCADPSFAVFPRARPPRINDGVTHREIKQLQTLEVSRHCFNGSNPLTNPPTPSNNGFILGQTPKVKEWVNDTKNFAARTIIRLQLPLWDMDWQLNIHGGQNRGDSRQFQHVGAQQEEGALVPGPTTGNSDRNGYRDADTAFTINPNGTLGSPVVTSPFQGDPFEGDYNNVEKEKIDLFGGSLVGDMSFGNYKLMIITGYEWNKRATDLNLDGSPYPSLEPNLKNSAYQLTEEVRLDWDDGNGVSWQLGSMFLYESLEVDNEFALDFGLPRTKQAYGFLTRYSGTWGSVDWEPSENFSIHAGVRVSYEDKEIALTSQQFNFFGGNPTSQEQFVSSAAREVGWAGDIIATYTPVTDVSLYLRYARGWKGPHINGGITNPGPSGTERGDLANPVEPEKIDSIEMGLKAQLWASRIRWNWAIFYYDYQDIQVFRLRNAGGAVPVQELINADDADVFGVEMELEVQPFDGWAHPIFENLTIRGTFAYLDSKYTDFVVTKDLTTFPDGVNPSTTTITEDFSGKRLVNSPEFSFIGFVQWPVGGEWGILVPRFDWSYKDKIFFGPENAELVSQDPLWLLNFRTTYKSPSENFEVSGWVKNLTDQRYTVDVFNLARLRNAILHAVGDPRTYGITVKVNF